MAGFTQKARDAAQERRSKKLYKKARRKREPKMRSRIARIARALLIVVAIALLVLPVLVNADITSYVPLIMVIVVVGLSWLYLQFADKGISVETAAAEYSCLRGESAQLTVRVVNSSFLPVPRVELGFVISNLFHRSDDVRSLACSLGPHQTLDVSFEASFAHLGRYEAGVRSVTVHDLLGIFSRTHKDATMNNVVVRPSKVKLAGNVADNATSDESSNALKPIASDNEDYASVREYHRGDPMKTIHWNLSSRNPDGTLYTRLFEEYVNPPMAVVIDCVAPDYDQDTLMSLFDGIVESAAALCEQARFAGVEAQVRFYDADGEKAACHLASDDDASELIERLHAIAVEGSVQSASLDANELLRACGLQNSGASNVAFITARADSECLTTLRDIAARRKNAMVFAAIPRDLTGRARDRFLEPILGLGASGVYHYVVESNPLGTEVMGL